MTPALFMKPHSRSPSRPETESRVALLGAGLHAGADHDRGAIGEARQAARRHLDAARDTLHDLDPAVPQVDAKRHLALAGDAVLDHVDLRDAREGRHRGARYGDGTFVASHDHVAVSEEPGPEPAVVVK